MANVFPSTRKLARIFLDEFESARVLSKMVNTQLLQGRFNPTSGTTVDFKRPTDTKTFRSSGGDMSGQTAPNLVVGKATGTVQDYFTAFVEFSAIDEALAMDQMSDLLRPYATRIVTDLETDFAQFMTENAGLSIGSPDTSVTTWQHIADAGALMQSIGVPKDQQWHYVMNPFTMAKVSDTVRSLGAGGAAAAPIMTALQKAILIENFAGMRVSSADSLYSFTGTAITDRTGSLSAAPDATYSTAKDTMTQVWAVTGFTQNLALTPGEILEVTGKFWINQSTKKPFLDAAGNALKFRAVVTAAVTLGSSGEGNVTVAGPAIFESDGAHNTVDAALANSDVVTLLGTSATQYQPNLFFHQNAFAIGSVPQKKLFSTDTLAETEDGLQIRVSRFSDGLSNVQFVRFDLIPAYAVLNPFFAGQGHA